MSEPIGRSGGQAGHAGAVEDLDAGTGRAAQETSDRWLEVSLRFEQVRTIPARNRRDERRVDDQAVRVARVAQDRRADGDRVKRRHVGLDRLADGRHDGRHARPVERVQHRRAHRGQDLLLAGDAAEIAVLVTRAGVLERRITVHVLTSGRDVDRLIAVVVSRVGIVVDGLSHRDVDAAGRVHDVAHPLQADHREAIDPLAEHVADGLFHCLTAA